MLLSYSVPAILLVGLTAAISPGDPNYDCAFHSHSSICQPVNDSPTAPIGDHINLDILATGLLGSTGLSVKLLNPKTLKETQLSWFQRDADGIEDGNLYSIITSHKSFFYGDTGPAFTGDGQLPCSLFDDNPGGTGTFYWLLTHYAGNECAYNSTSHCYPFLVVIPPVEGSKSILLRDNADVCGR